MNKITLLTDQRRPGISSFGPKPEELAAYLKPLFDHASSIIPSHALADTPVYVLATAGMRLLPEDQRNTLLEATCSYIENETGFTLGQGGCADHVQVITGEEEGLLGWIAINYLMDGFHFKGNHALDAGQTEGTKGKSTYGFLDMGGASTQIAFEPSKDALAKAAEKNPVGAQEDLTPITLRMLDGTDVTHNVFVTTFLGFGTNKARERYVSALTQGTSSAEVLKDACLPTGLSVPSGPSSANLIGTGSFTNCLEHLEPLLEKHASCSHPPCLFHGVHVPPIDFSVNHFIGVSEYWFSSNDVFGLGGVYDFVSFQKAAQEFCHKPWSELDKTLKEGKTFGKQVDEGRLQLQCFKAAWMTTVLHEGIGIPRIVDDKGKGDGKHHADEAQDKADEKNLFQSVNDVDGLSVSWTLGKAVWEASKDIPPPRASGPLDAAIVSGDSPHTIADGGSGSVSSSNGVKIGAGASDSADKSNSWRNQFRPSWHRPSDPLANLPPIRAGRHSISGGLVALISLTTFAILLFCCFFRGRGPKALRRRAVFRDILPPPLGSLGGLMSTSRRPRGDYVLASMEEAQEGGIPGDGNIMTEATSGDIALSSDVESDDADPRGRSRHKRRRSSGNGLVATLLLVPIQRLALALGMRNAAAQPARGPAGLGQRRRQLYAATPSRLPLRRNFSNPMLVARISRPSSPSGPGTGVPLMSGPATSSVGPASLVLGSSSAAASTISRPASRTANTGRLSPRSLSQYNAAAEPSYFANNGGASGANHLHHLHHLHHSHPHHHLHSAISSATASAYSSRAASPIPFTSTEYNPASPPFSAQRKVSSASSTASSSGATGPSVLPTISASTTPATTTGTLSRVNSSTNVSSGGPGFSRRGWDVFD